MTRARASVSLTLPPETRILMTRLRRTATGGVARDAVSVCDAGEEGEEPVERTPPPHPPLTC